MNSFSKERRITSWQPLSLRSRTGAMAEERDTPVHKIKYGRINGWIYRIGGERDFDYLFEYFRWFKPTPRSNWKKAHRVSYGRDFYDLAGCLERADIWIAEQQGRHLSQAEEIRFSPKEVAAILHLLSSVRRLNTESQALWRFEQRIRSVLGKMNTEQVNEAVSKHEGSELYEHIEEIRKQLRPYRKAS